MKKTIERLPVYSFNYR